MTRILHISDTHGTAGSYADFDALRRSVPNLDAAVHTGDVCPAWWEDGIGDWSFANTLFTVGNHDAILKAGNDMSNHDWRIRPTQEQLYNRFFKTWKSNGAVVDENATWWTKELGSVTLIGIDQTVTGDAIAMEETWLQGVFGKCLAAGRVCIVCSHISNERAAAPAPGTWKSSTSGRYYPDSLGNYYSFLTRPFDIAEAYRRKGLKLAFWFTGHWHFDALWTQNTFPVVTLNSAIADGYGDLVRDGSPQGRLCANLYDYDERQNTLTVYRMGACNTFDGRMRKMMVVDCSTGVVMNQCMG